MLIYEIFFANLYLYHFLSFSWSRQTFQVIISHILCLHKLLFNFGFYFSCCFLCCSTSFIEFVNQIIYRFVYFSVIGGYARCFILCSPFWPIFFYSRTGLGVTFKKGSSTNEFRIAAISSHAFPLSTLPWRCIQGWIRRISLKIKISCRSVQTIDQLIKKSKINKKYIV